MTGLRTKPLAPALDIDEKTWDAQLFSTNPRDPGLARRLGWELAYHVLRSKGSEPGFPDRVLVRERVVFLELKRECGKLSDAQKRWVAALLDAGAETYVARPADLDDLARVLAHRGDPRTEGFGAAVQAARRLRDATRAEAAA